MEYQVQEFDEKFNILNNEISKERNANHAFKLKISRYSGLKDFIEKINDSLDLDYVADSLISFIASSIPNKNGVYVLYLVNNLNQKLGLFKTKKEDEKLVVRAKEGDIFDHWVLRHAIPLFIEDTKKDFRFDLEKLKLHDLRPVSSLVSSPFISEHRFLGMLRLDNPDPNYYSQDDLRFLATICDLGAVALENTMLFQETQNLAIHDGLTAVYTKGYFLERLKQECKRSLLHNEVFSLLLLDIDNFKNYNDQFGHTAGDIVLKKISQHAVDSLKASGSIVSRFGGEEFCVILPGADKKRACALADTLRQRIEAEEVILRRKHTHVTVSIGVAGFPEDAKDEDELIMNADKAMYTAKKKGRNRVCCI